MEASSDVDGYNYMIEIDLGEAESLTACFNNGSNSWDSNGGKNYTFGIGYYTFSSGKITQIDEPSKTLTITSLSADKNTPQTIGEVINFTSSVKNATGEVSYKYEVTKDNITTTISEDSKAVWTPTEIGTYIVKLTVVDEANNTDTKTMTYTIKEVSQNTVTIYYSGYNNPYIHYKISGKSWTSAPGVKMDASSEISGYGYSITIDLGDADSLTACFNNGNGSWDSNGGKNYTFKVGNYTFKNGNITKIN